MTKDETFERIKKLLSEKPKETQDTMLLSSFVQLDALSAINDPDSLKQKLLDGINNEVDKLTLTELILLHYLIKTMVANTEYRNAKEGLRMDVEKVRETAYQEGFDKGKELRIKDLKRMREF